MMDIKKFDQLMYFLLKDATSESFVDYLECAGLTEEDYKEIKKHIEETYGIKLYV